MLRSHRSALVLLTLASLVWPGSRNSIHAQSVTAILVGTISDQSGAAVPKATLSITRTGTNLRRTVVSNEKGDFTIPNLEPGSYQLIGEQEGFKRTIIEGIELLVNQTARVDVVLQVGAVAESVEVTGATPLVESETSSVGQVVERNLISDLPIKGRAVFDLALLTPATVPTNPSSYLASVPCPAVSLRLLSLPPVDAITAMAIWWTA